LESVLEEMTEEKDLIPEEYSEGIDTEQTL
jgi:hypothetical protein